MARDSLRERYVEMLMDQVRSARYPSISMLERLEKVLPDRDAAEEYVHTLIDVMEEKQYPSPDLMNRVSGLIRALDGMDGASRA